MAYRQLCAAAFVMFGMSVACGGGTASNAVDPRVDDPSPPSADDPPPSSSDQAPPSSDDTPPSSPDAPPSNPDSPGGAGGRLQQLCEDACQVLERLSECPDGMDIDRMSTEVCRNGGCAMAIDPGQPIPCLDEIEGLFGCIARLPDVCMPTEAQARACLDEVESFSDCAELQPSDPDPEPSGQSCMPDSCNNCPTECSECYCENAELGAGAIELCSDVCPTSNR